MSHIGSTIPCVQYNKQLQCYDKSFATYFCKTHEIKLPPSLLIFGGGRPILGAYTLMTCPVLPKLLENAEGAAAHQSTFLHLP